uniref:Uncharacterized protein n=1 Tax=viral metagenome TaxID=1070528 RepID=A0A6M3J6T9_9ZZZZ
MTMRTVELCLGQYKKGPGELMGRMTAIVRVCPADRAGERLCSELINVMVRSVKWPTAVGAMHRIGNYEVSQEIRSQKTMCVTGLVKIEFGNALKAARRSIRSRTCRVFPRGWSDSEEEVEK